MFPLLVAIFFTVADQATKEVVRLRFELGESHPVIAGFFSLTYVRNTGAAWGTFGGQNTYLTIFSVVMLAVMLVYHRSFLSDTWEHRLALGLLFGGIIGNLLDRIRLGFVTDFFDFYVKDWHWPVFNIADSAICIGVGIYVISAFWLSTHPLNESRKAAAAASERGSPMPP